MPAAQDPVETVETDVELMVYEDYRKTKLWRVMKKRVKERDGGRCWRCGGGSDVVHHRSYDREVLEGRADHLLVSLCDHCHQFVHFTPAGAKRSIADTDEALLFTPVAIEFPPPPSADLRRKMKTSLPDTWYELNGAQRKRWREAFVRSQAARLAVVSEQKRATQPRVRATAEGYVSLRDAVTRFRQEDGAPQNAVDWYRKSAQEQGHVNIGEGSWPAAKVRGVWCMLSADVDAAIEAHRGAVARRDSVTADYSRGIYHGSGERIRTHYGWYEVRGNTRFVYSNYANAKGRDAYGVFCNQCSAEIRDGGSTCAHCGLAISVQAGA